MTSGPAGSVVGPFTVTTERPARHGHRRRAGACSRTRQAPQPIADRSLGAVRPDRSGCARLVPPARCCRPPRRPPFPPATSTSTTATTPGVTDAQKLILAQSATLTTTVQATAQFLPPGSLVVKKTIAGPAAGSQGQVVIHVDCDDGVTRADFVIPAGTRAGDKSKTYTDIPAGTVCTVTETSDGSVVGTDGGGDRGRAGGDDPLRRERDGPHHRYLSLRRRAAREEDDRRSGCGPAGGDHGSTRSAMARPLTPDFVIPAGTPAGDQTKQYDQIDAPATCTVTETADGHTSTVPVVVDRERADSVRPGRSGRRSGHHRHLRRRACRRSGGRQSGVGRVPARHQDHRRPARRPPGTGHHPRGLQRHRPVARLRDRREGPGGPRVAQLRRDPGRRRRAPSPRPRTAPPPTSGCTVVGNRPDGDRSRGQGGTGEPEQRVPGRVRRPEGDQDDRRAGRAPARSHRHPGGLRRSAEGLRVPHPGPHAPPVPCRATSPTSRARSRCVVTETADGRTRAVAVAGPEAQDG